MTAPPQHEHQLNFSSTHPTSVDNFEANMFVFSSCCMSSTITTCWVTSSPELNVLHNAEPNNHGTNNSACFELGPFVVASLSKTMAKQRGVSLSTVSFWVPCTSTTLAAWASVLHKHPKHSAGMTKTSLLTSRK